MTAPSVPIAYHLIPVDVWEGAPADQPLRVGSLAHEGFIHLTQGMADLVDVANDRYRDDPRPFLVLTVAFRWLTSPWRFDGDERYPHVYGPIERTSDGTFLPIRRADLRTPPDMPALLSRLVEGDVDFVVIGSSGAALLGAALLPGDLDVCPDPDAENLGRLAAILTDLGAPPRVAVPGWVTEEDAKMWHPEPTIESLDFLFETPLGDLDIVAFPLGPGGRGHFEYASLAESAVRVEVDAHPIAVASPEHLLASKLGARRPKDLKAREELEPLVNSD